MTPVAKAHLLDDSGRLLIVGAAPLGRGGEGSVFELRDEPSRVAKIYHSPAFANERKLKAMVRLGTNNAALLRMSAWPERTVRISANGPVVGFVMRRASGASLSDLLGPGSRRVQFPHSSFPFVVRAARNLAVAFDVAHRSHAVIGDVKEINAYVDNDAMVTLLDTDGFQITDPNGTEVYRTLAVTPSHQPPELQGIPALGSVTRLPEQDAFGLAVLIFQLLFMGRHPFSGRPVSRIDLEIHDAIKRGQFAWAPDLTDRLYEQPPHTLALADVGSLGPLFMRAFLPPTVKERPTPANWAEALKRYEQELRACEVNPAHASLGVRCPLCQVEMATGTVLFLRPRAAGGSAAPLDLAAAWAAIMAIGTPGQSPALPVPTAVAASIPELKARAKGKFAAALLAFGIRPRLRIAKGPYVAAERAARQRVTGLEQQWRRETGDEAFKDRLSALQAAGHRLRVLELERAQRLNDLKGDLRQRRLERYLRGHFIARAHIDGLTAKRLNTLREFRIETAADLTEFNVGWLHAWPQLQQNLKVWRQTVERGFKFDPARGLDAEDVNAVDQELADRRSADEQLLRIGPLALKQISDHAYRRRLELLPAIQAAQAELAQAEANLKAVT